MEVHMDLEAESIISIDTGNTKDIAESCNKLLETQEQIKTAEEKVKKLREIETVLSEQTIPNLMQKTGVQKIELNDGTKVEVKPFYAARIPISKTDEAFTWLRDNNHGSLIKNDVSLSFTRNQDNEAKALVEELKNKGLDVKQKESVHPSTLKGFVKDQIERGQHVPADLFGTYVSNKTKLTTKE